jgi:CheY-like chemotaxis protein
MQNKKIKHPTILIAEDDAGHFALVKKNIWRTCADAEIVRFRNGKELLDYFFGDQIPSHDGRTGRYLLLLDIKMPLMDGVSALEKIKSNPELKKMPVFMLTTTDNPGEINHCYQIGCNFYIVKPSDYMQFMLAMEYLGAFLSMSGLTIPEIDPDKAAKYN